MLRFRRDRAANTPSVSTGIGHRRCEPARPPRNALRRFTFVRHHDAPMASFRPALTETRQRNRPSTGRPVNSGPRPCLFDVGFPLSGLQDRTYTSDLNIRAQHTRSSARPSGLAALQTRARSPNAVPTQRYRHPSGRCPTLTRSTHNVFTERGAVHGDLRRVARHVASGAAPGRWPRSAACWRCAGCQRAARAPLQATGG